MRLTGLHRLFEVRGLDKGVDAVILHVKLALVTDGKAEGASKKGAATGRALERHF
jgi:hypothetical protein